jgi:hypothetical protein
MGAKATLLRHKSMALPDSLSYHVVFDVSRQPAMVVGFFIPPGDRVRADAFRRTKPNEQMFVYEFFISIRATA